MHLFGTGVELQDEPTSPTKKEKLSFHCRGYRDPYQLEDSATGGERDMGQLFLPWLNSEHVLSIYGALLTKLVVLTCLILWHLAHQSVASFVSACMSGCSKSGALTFIRKLQLAFQRI